jgi:hypothetical protein
MSCAAWRSDCIGPTVTTALLATCRTFMAIASFGAAGTGALPTLVRSESLVE